MGADRSKNLFKHRIRQNAGVRIIAGAMIAIEEGRTVEVMDSAMRERVGRERVPEAFDHRIMGNTTERDNRLEPLRAIDGFFKIWAAGFDFSRGRFVLWWHTAHRVRDPRRDQRQTIIGPRFINAFGKSKFDQSAIEKIARIIAGEGSTGAVGAF